MTTRILFYFLGLFSISVVFFACTREPIDSGEVGPNLTGGTWAVSKLSFSSELLPDSSVSNLGNITFNSNGTGNTNTTLLPGVLFDDIAGTNFTWQASGSNISINFKAKSESSNIAITYNSITNTTANQVLRVYQISSNNQAISLAVKGLTTLYNIDYTLTK